MRFRIVPLEERVVLDASGAHEVFSLEDYLEKDHLDFDGTSQASSWMNPEMDIRVLVISSEIPHPEKLVRAALQEVEIVYYNAKDSSLNDLSREIAETLGENKASSIAFANHGKDGLFYLTPDQIVSSESLENEHIQVFWQNVSSHVKKDGRIDLLACNLASSPEGLDLLNELENLTGTNFAASTDLTGSEHLSADWILESDNIYASLLYFDSSLIESWQGALSTPLTSSHHVGQALSFDGVDDYISIPNSTSLNLDSNFTIEAWIYCDGKSSQESIIIDKSDSLNTHYQLFFNPSIYPGHIGLRQSDPSNTIYNNTPLQEGQWYHIAVSHDGTNTRFYINGSLDGERTDFSSGESNNADLSIAGSPLLSEHFFEGKIDEIRLWNISRTEEEISEHYDKVLYGLEGGLCGYWRFNAGSGDTAFDYSSNSNHGSLEGNLGNTSSILLNSFDSSRQGWKTIYKSDGSEGFTFSYPSGGNLGGYISTYDLSSSGLYWKSPPIFTGNLSTAYGGELSFDMKQTDQNNSYNSAEDVILRGNDLEIVHDIDDPGLLWTSYHLPLHESASWKILHTGENATDLQIQSVLGSLQALEINANFSSSLSVVDLDNVEISTISNPKAHWIHSTAPLSESLFTLEDSDLIIYLRGVDGDGDNIQAKITSLPTNGSLLQIDGSAIVTNNTTVSDASGRVVFRPSPNESGTPYSTFGFSITDGLNTSNASITTVSVIPVDDAPFLLSNNPLAVDEASTKAIDNSYLHFIDDKDSSFVTKYILDSIPSHGVIKREDSPLSIGSTFTQSDIDQGRILYTHDDSETTSDQFSFRVQDGEDHFTESFSFSININRINDSPPDIGGDITVTDLLGNPVSINEDTPNPQAANIRLTVPNLSDSDAATPHQIRIFAVSGGSLKQTDGSTIEVGENGSILELSAGSYDFIFQVSEDREIAASIRYGVVDPDDPSMHSEESEAIIPITAVNDAPIISSQETTPLLYTENDGICPIDQTISLQDRDTLPQADLIANQIHQATIAITNGYMPEEDLLIFSNTDDIQGSFESSNGVLTLTGIAPLLHYEKALQSVSYYNKSENPQTNSRTIEFIVNDGQTSSNSIERSISLSSSNDEPVAIGVGPGKSLVFDGLDDLARIEGVDLNNTSFTLSLWSKRNALDGEQHTIISMGESGTNSDLSIGFNKNDAFYVEFSGNTLVSNQAIDDTNWHHYAISYDVNSQEKNLYVDGELLSSSTSIPPFQESGTLYLGKNHQEDSYFSGAIDELRIYDRELSGEEIQENIDKLLSGDEENLIAYLRFDEGFGIKTKDQSSANHLSTLGSLHQSLQTIENSTFEIDSDGWQIHADGSILFTPQYQSSGGHGGGHISLTNPDATYSYWQASDKYLGDLSNAYGGILHYELKNSGSGDFIESDDIILQGEDLSISYNTDKNPSSSQWTSYDIPLFENAGWVNLSTGLSPTKMQMQNVLNSLNQLSIRAEYFSESDSFHLDNVLLAKSNIPHWKDSQAGIAETVTLEENSDATIVLGGADADFNPLQAKINRLVNLFQYNSGLRGIPITSSNLIITDPLLRVVFGANTADTTSFSFHVNDGNSDSNEADVNIFVSAVNNPPSINLPSTPPSILEDFTSSISGISIDDVDVNESENGSITAQVSVDHGNISLEQTVGLNFLIGDGTYDQTMKFRGSLDNINAAISTITYEGEKNYHGDETLHITVNDEGNTGSGGALEDQTNFSFSVGPQNDKPSIELSQPTHTAIEDSISSIGNILIQDIDISDPLSLESVSKITLFVENGTLSVDGGPRDSSLVLVDTLTGLNNSLTTLDYLSNTDYNGVDSLSITVNDRERPEFTDSLEEHSSISIDVLPSNDPPTISLPASQSVDENKNLFISSVSIGDPLDTSPEDFSLYEVHLSLEHGSASLYHTSEITFSSGNGTAEKEMTFQGTISQINSVLSSLLYRPDLHYHGTDTLNLTVSDLGNTGQGDVLTASASMIIEVNSVDDPYTILAPNALAIEEGESLAITGLSIKDIDLTTPVTIDPNTVPIKVSLSVQHGTISTSESTSAPSITLSQSLQGVNDLLQTLTYQSEDDFKGSDNLLINILNDDSEIIASKAIFLTVDAVNDPPVLTVPTDMQITDEEQSITIEGFSVFDPDISQTINGHFQVSLSVNHGILHLKQIGGLTFTEGKENGKQSLEFTGTPEDVNNAFSAIAYASNTHYNGVDTLQVSVSDLGNSGLGNALEDSKSVSITVNPINDAPSLLLPSSQETYEDEALTISGLQVNDLDINETPNSSISVSLSSNQGGITLLSTEGITFNASENGNHSISFSGNIESVNAALMEIIYLPDLNTNGSDTISVSVNDHGFSGLSPTQGNFSSIGAKTASGEILMEIHAVNDSPILDAPDSQTVFEDSPTLISGIEVEDLDSNETPHALLHTTLQSSQGTIAILDTTGIDILVGDKSGDTFIEFQGSLFATNFALKNIEYTGDLHYHSNETHEAGSLIIQVNDRGNSGIVKNSDGNLSSSQDLKATHQITIPIQALNDPPALHFPQEKTVDEDQDLSIHLEVDDRDFTIVEDLECEVSLSVQHGFLSLSNVDDISFSLGDASNEKHVIFKGTIPAINSALDILNYRGEANYHGTDTLNIAINDGGNTGQGNVLSIEGETLITVNPINDQPLLTVPGIQDPNEDSDHTIGGISLADIDTHMDENIECKVTLSVEHGKITLNDISGLDSNKIIGNGEDTVVLQGTIPTLNAALDNLIYHSDLNYHDGDIMNLHVTDLGNISLTDPAGTPSVILTHDANIPINVHPINDAPIIEVPQSQTIDEEQILPIIDLSLDDQDTTRRPDIPLEVTLSVSNGTLWIENTEEISFSVGDGNGNKIQTFQGTIPAINAALSTLSYLGDTDYHGADTLHVGVDDLGNVSDEGIVDTLTDNKSIAITVNPVNDAPVWSVPQAQSIHEDTDLTISGISFDDRDIAMNEDIEFEVTASVNHGVITLPTTSGLTFLQGSNAQESMTFTGNLANINAALENLKYRANLHYHDSDSLELSISDQGNISPLDSNLQATEILEDSASIAIDVIPVNDPPQWSTPGLQNVNEDSPLTIEGISLDDRDITRRPNIELEVTLSVEHGTLSLNSLEGLSFTEGSGVNDRSMTFKGLLAKLNSALDNMEYHPDQDYHDTDHIDLHVTDLGNTSSLDNDGNPVDILEQSARIDLIVIPINDPPSWSVPSSQTVNEDSDLFINGISLNDPDITRRPDIDLEVTLSVNHGTLTLAEQTDLSFSLGNGIEEREMTFRGDVPSLNAALSTIKYHADNHYHGEDSIALRVNDLNNVTAGNDAHWGSPFSLTLDDIDTENPAHNDGLLLDDATIDIEVSPVNDAPTLIIPESQVVKEDTDILIEGFSIDDRDITMDPSISLELTLSAQRGVISLHSLADLTQLSFQEGDGHQNEQIVLQGTVANINAALESITYRANENYHGEDSIFIKVDDLGNLGQILPPVEGVLSLTVVDENAVEVEAINDPATIDLPETQLTQEETSHAIEGITLGDPDTTITPDIELEVHLSVNHGTLTLDLQTLNQDPNFSVFLTQGSGTSDKNVSFRGKIIDLNKTLSTLLYQGDTDYNLHNTDSLDVLNIQVNDLGNTGTVHFPNGVPVNVSVLENEQLLTTANLDIQVSPINDRPILSVPTTVQINPDTNAEEEKAFLSVNEDEVLAIEGISIFDVDINEVANTKIEVRMEVSFGTLKFREEDLSTLEFTQGSGNGDKLIIFSSSLSSANQALSGLEYLGDLNYNSNTSGNDFLNIQVNDLGNTGSGGDLKDEKTIEIAIHAVNDQPDDINIEIENEEGTISEYTVIASFDTVDVDLEDVNLHSYTLLDSPHSGYLIENNQLLIAHNALLSFEGFSHEQEILVQTTDPGGLSTEQKFLISDRDLPSEVQETLPDDVKVFINKAIASAAKNLKGVLSIDAWSDNYDELKEGSELAGTEADEGLNEAFSALEDQEEEEEGSIEEGSFGQFKNLLRARSLPRLLERFFY